MSSWGAHLVPVEVLDATTGLLVDPGDSANKAIRVNTVAGTVTTTPPANATTNVTQFGGNPVVTDVGASGPGIPRVTLSNDSVISSITNPVAITATSLPLPANAAQETGGNLATMVTLLTRMEDLVHLTRRHLAATRGLYALLAAQTDVTGDIDEFIATDLSTH